MKNKVKRKTKHYVVNLTLQELLIPNSQKGIVFLKMHKNS